MVRATLQHGILRWKRWANQWLEDWSSGFAVIFFPRRSGGLEFLVLDRLRAVELATKATMCSWQGFLDPKTLQNHRLPALVFDEHFLKLVANHPAGSQRILKTNCGPSIGNPTLFTIVHQL